MRALCQASQESIAAVRGQRIPQFVKHASMFSWGLHTQIIKIKDYSSINGDFHGSSLAEILRHTLALLLNKQLTTDFPIQDPIRTAPQLLSPYNGIDMGIAIRIALLQKL